MIRLSNLARRQVSSLIRHYERLERPEASANLRSALARVSERIEAQSGVFLQAPRPYPNATRPGWLWLKENRYWFGFTSRQDESVIQVIFHEAADIPGRL